MRFRKCIPPMSIVLFIVLTLAGTYYIRLRSLEVRSRGDMDSCHGNLRFLEMAVAEYLQNTRVSYSACPIDLRATNPVVYIAQAEGEVSAECLVCPCHPPDKRPFTFAMLNDQNISYETWPFPTLLLFKETIQDRESLLIWEKRPNHNGKCHVAELGGTIRLIDDADFRAMRERTKLEIENAIKRVDVRPGS